jgi:hypothetical protein
MKLNTWAKIFIVSSAFTAAVIGFMIKLPASFKHIDKELHTAFYFLSAAFLNFLFANKKPSIHLLIFVTLFLFGISIEYVQEYSNKLLHVKIHGRFDPEDVKSNLKGLVAFSICWVVYVVCIFIYKSATVKEASNMQ